MNIFQQGFVDEIEKSASLKSSAKSIYARLVKPKSYVVEKTKREENRIRNMYKNHPQMLDEELAFIRKNTPHWAESDIAKARLQAALTATGVGISGAGTYGYIKKKAR